MKKALLTVFLLLFLPVFSSAASTNDTYRCRYLASIEGEAVIEYFVLGDGLGFVNFEKILSGKRHFFHFNIFKDQDHYRLQYMEGHQDADGGAVPVNGIYTWFVKRQKIITIATFACSGDRSCWNIRCTLIR